METSGFLQEFKVKRNLMTGRERILNCLDHKEVDRVPVSPFIWENFVREFYQSHDVDLIEGTAEVYEHFSFDIIHRT